MQSWQDLQRQQARAEAVRTAASPAAASAPTVASLPAAATSPRLQQLLAQRQQLEGRMQGLTGQAGPTGTRYPVASAAERRAEMQRWIAQRERERAPRAPVAPGLATPRLARPDRDAAGREPGTPTNPGAWSRLRDARQQAGRSIDGVEAALASTDALDARRLSGSLDQALQREDLSDADRTAARRGLDEAMGGLRSALDGPRRKVQEGIGRARDALAAGERIERDWQQRRDDIAGWDLARVAQRYEQRRHRLLEVATGSVAQLAERMDGLRQMLQQRRAEDRAQERQDAARRERALTRRQQRREEEEGSSHE